MAKIDSRQSLNQLAALFRATQPARPIVLLGAGASFRSGVPLADALVAQIARLAFARLELGNPAAISRVTLSDWKPFLEKQPWFTQGADRLADNFPYAVEHFLKPQSVRRDFFVDVISDKTPSQGYLNLAELIMHRLCSTVLTTNFDSLIYQALIPLQAHVREIVEVNRTADDLHQFSTRNRCQIVYLHGAVELYRDRNLPQETQRLDEDLVNRLWPVLTESPLVVIGYRGAEPSITRHLLREGISRCDRFRHGIFWCTRTGTELHPEVRGLQKELGPNFQELEIDGFDELMADLKLELGEETLIRRDEDVHIGPVSMWDSKPVEGALLEEIDIDLALVTLQVYAQRLGFPAVDHGNLEAWLVELRLAVKKDGILVPTNSGILLFGKEPQKRFPHAVVAFVTSQKKQEVFSGNLIQQFESLHNRLQDRSVNSFLRLKNDTGSEDIDAYPARALTELIINLLVHRDYEIEDYSRIEHEPGVRLTFVNPGGLMPRVHARFRPEENGEFAPIRGESELRNPTLADVFFGRGQLDKAGSGLPDVRELMPKHGGRSSFACLKVNTIVATSLLQAVQQLSRTNVASRLGKTEVFITNLLPFRIIPSAIYSLPLRDANAKQLTFETDLEAQNTPTFLLHGGWALSFADFSQVPQFSERNGYLAQKKTAHLEDFVRDEDNRRLFVWLVGRHWNFFLKSFSVDGLRDDFRGKRAYFELRSGAANAISYITRTGRKATREVVKLRGPDAHPWYENEGFCYQIIQMSGEWSLQVNLRMFLPAKTAGNLSRVATNRVERRGDSSLIEIRWLTTTCHSGRSTSAKAHPL
jgi:SIR2-like domain